MNEKQNDNASVSRFRIGGKVLLNVYDRDRPIFQCHTPEDAALYVGLLNGWDSIEQTITELREQLAMKAQELIGQVDSDAWKAVIKYAYTDGGDGAQNIYNVTSEFIAMRSERDTLRSRLEQAQKDTERLDWLMEQIRINADLSSLSWWAQLSFIGLRKTIDIARPEPVSNEASAKCQKCGGIYPSKDCGCVLDSSKQVANVQAPDGEGDAPK